MMTNKEIGQDIVSNDNNNQEVVEKISFFDDETGEEILFEVIDEVIIDNIKYILVVDEEDISTILKQTNEINEELNYALVEDEDEFKKAAVEFMTSEDYDIEL